MANPGFKVGRPPCAGWPATAKQAQKSCYQHTRASEKKVQVYHNVTKVPDYRCPPGGSIDGNACTPDPDYSASGIPPYSRVSDGLCVDRAYSSGDSWPDCINVPPCTCPGCDGTCDEHDYGSPQCNAWGTPPPVLTCTGLHETEVDFNCYELVPNVFADLSHCRKIGFKNAQAVKAWHGRFGYRSHDHQPDIGFVDLPKGWGAAHGGDSCDCPDLPFAGSGIEFEQPTADNTKYLLSSVDYSLTLSGLDGGSSTGDSGVISALVNRYSGVQSWQCGGGQLGKDWLALLGVSAAFSFKNVAGRIANCLPTGAPSSPSCSSADYPSPYDTCWDVSFSGLSTTVTTMQYVFDHFAEDGVTPVFESKVECVSTVNASAGTLTITQYGPDADNNWVVIYSESWTFTNTDYTGTISGFETSTGQTLSGTITGHLDNPYTATELYQDVLDLLNVNDLSNDITYPWRLDSFVGIAPTALRNEPGPVIPSWSCVDLDEDGFIDPDPNGLLYDGSILGRPTSYGGQDKGHFDFRHTTWRGCVGDSGETRYYKYAYGAYSGQSNKSDATDGVLPKTATRWTENFDSYGTGVGQGGAIPLSGSTRWTAGDKPAGAWLLHAGSQLHAQKWAEIKIHRPSYNFARPCGEDRFALHEASVRCVVSVSGSGSEGDPIVLNLETASGGIAVDDLCYICSVPGVTSGVYKVTAISGVNYTVELQTGWPPAPMSDIGPIINCGAGILGKLRWPNKPGICGRLPVICAAGTPILCTTGLATQLVTGDQVDITGIAALAASPYTVTVIDANNFTLNGTSAGADLGGGFVSTHGATHRKWNDDQSKGDFFFAYWNFNFRDFQERDRVIAQYAACSDCTPALPGDLTVIRPNQDANGMPRQVSDYAVEKHCLAFTVCDPQVLFIGPSHAQLAPEYDAVTGKIKFANSFARNFPDAFLADERYGAMWQAAFVQTITDPLWETPHRPCEEGNDVNPDPHALLCQWLEDNCSGCCEDSCDESLIGVPEAPPQKRYYAHHPVVEAIDGIPAQFDLAVPQPSLPAGIVLHYLTFAELQLASPPDGGVMPPPTGNGYTDGDEQLQPIEADTPWQLFFDEVFCVCGGGQFSDAYEANGAAVSCP